MTLRDINLYRSLTIMTLQVLGGSVPCAGSIERRRCRRPWQIPGIRWVARSILHAMAYATICTLLSPHAPCHGTPFAHAGEVDADIAQHLKRLTKREAVTRIKALQARVLLLAA